MHPTRDTTAFIFSRGLGGRVMPGVMLLSYFFGREAMKHWSWLVLWVALLCSGLMPSPVRATSAAYQEKKEGHRAEIKSQPQPENDQSQQRGYSGTVTVRAILRSSGKVTDVEVIEITPEDLPKEVAEDWAKKCIEAARQIKSKPAMKNGHPASQYVKLLYTFKAK
ncbi:MAG: energy transducer TonB [Pyrinomonadaceae bacterium]